MRGTSITENFVLDPLCKPGLRAMGEDPRPESQMDAITTINGNVGGSVGGPDCPGVTEMVYTLQHS